MKAAEGYKKTGATVALDGSEDNLIVREAGSFWRDMGMRAIVDREMEVVAEEVAAAQTSGSASTVRPLSDKGPSRKSQSKAPPYKAPIGAVCTPHDNEAM